MDLTRFSIWLSLCMNILESHNCMAHATIFSFKLVKGWFYENVYMLYSFGELYMHYIFIHHSNATNTRKPVMPKMS